MLRFSTNGLDLQGFCSQSMQHSPELSLHLIFLLDGVYLHSQSSTGYSIIRQVEGWVETMQMCNQQHSQRPALAVANAPGWHDEGAHHGACCYNMKSSTGQCEHCRWASGVNPP